MKPLVKRRRVEVELPSVATVNGKEKAAQVEPVLESTPMAEKVAQPAVLLPADETIRSVVEATEVERVVVVA